MSQSTQPANSGIPSQTYAVEVRIPQFGWVTVAVGLPDQASKELETELAENNPVLGSGISTEDIRRTRQDEFDKLDSTHYLDTGPHDIPQTKEAIIQVARQHAIRKEGPAPQRVV